MVCKHCCERPLVPHGPVPDAIRLADSPSNEGVNHRGKLTSGHRERLLVPKMALPFARAWVEIGDLLATQSQRRGISPATALAVWNVECGALPFVPGQPVLRLECHKLWEQWGHRQPDLFDAHFQFGGRPGIDGLPWTNQKFRHDPTGEWLQHHGNQALEHEAFQVAARLAGPEHAALAASFGGPQILGINHDKVGYPSATAMYRAFAQSLHAQVEGFFAFCEAECLVPVLAARDWLSFATVYNGTGNAHAYAERISDAYLMSDAFLNGDSQTLQKQCRRLSFDQDSFNSLVSSWRLRHFSARELIFRGSANCDPSHPAYNLNNLPPRKLWPNIRPSILGADQLRSLVGRPARLVSIYRSPRYNAAVGGTAGSAHERFSALEMSFGAELSDVQLREAVSITQAATGCHIELRSLSGSIYVAPSGGEGG